MVNSSGKQTHFRVHHTSAEILRLWNGLVIVMLSECRELVTNNLLAVARKFSRPRLASLAAARDMLRLSIRCNPNNSCVRATSGVSYHYLVGVPRIELGSHEPESCILPLYYTPIFFYFYRTYELAHFFVASLVCSRAV